MGYAELKIRATRLIESNIDKPIDWLVYMVQRECGLSEKFVIETIKKNEKAFQRIKKK